MTLQGWLQILLYSGIILALTKPVGVFLYRVFETSTPPMGRWLGPIERGIYRLGGVDETREQKWQEYAISMLLFSLLGVLVTYGIQRLQNQLPYNPQGMAAVSEHLSFNTAVSFTTNTNWQSYSGESTMSYLTQMAGLAWHNFTSAAVGIGVALALARGLTRRGNSNHIDPGSINTVGNFWVDIVRGIVYVLMPVSIVGTLVLCSTGIVQNFSPYVEVNTLEGAKQVLPMGPMASQEIIKELGTNGGGFLNANSSHPFENPTPLSNLLEMLLIFAIPAGLTYTYGRMAGDQREGWTIFAAMAVLFFVGVTVAYAAESSGNTAFKDLPIQQTAGNMEGKEVRFGIANSALFATVTTDASCGAVNSMHDSFTPLGGMVPLVNIQLGEIIFGGVGAGLYGMLVYVVLSVFIAGLMVGRTPEYLGKKIESREVKLATLYVLIFPLIILGLAAWSSVVPQGVSSLNNAGPHGLSEILYAYSSATGNNGSAFAGLNANTPWWDTTMGLAMLFGRFFMIVPAIAIGGAMVGKRTVPAGLGTFPTNSALFTFLLLGVVVIVGALTFFPALVLGPIVEHYLAGAGKFF